MDYKYLSDYHWMVARPQKFHVQRSVTLACWLGALMQMLHAGLTDPREMGRLRTCTPLDPHLLTVSRLAALERDYASFF